MELGVRHATRPAVTRLAPAETPTRRHRRPALTWPAALRSFSRLHQPPAPVAWTCRGPARRRTPSPGLRRRAGSRQNPTAHPGTVCQIEYQLIRHPAPNLGRRAKSVAVRRVMSPRIFMSSCFRQLSNRIDRLRSSTGRDSGSGLAFLRTRWTGFFIAIHLVTISIWALQRNSSHPCVPNLFALRGNQPQTPGSRRYNGLFPALRATSRGRSEPGTKTGLPN
jgi:hypothetical protein